MTDEQKAAYIMAQAAILNATIAGMVAKNQGRASRGETMAYDEEDFVIEIDDSSCHHHAVLNLFQE